MFRSSSLFFIFSVTATTKNKFNTNDKRGISLIDSDPILRADPDALGPEGFIADTIIKPNEKVTVTVVAQSLNFVLPDGKTPKPGAPRSRDFYRSYIVRDRPHAQHLKFLFADANELLNTTKIDWSSLLLFTKARFLECHNFPIASIAPQVFLEIYGNIATATSTTAPLSLSPSSSDGDYNNNTNNINNNNALQVKVHQKGKSSSLLQSLSISRPGVTFTDDLLEKVLDLFPNLRALWITCAPSLTPKAFDIIASSPCAQKLVDVRIRLCTNISPNRQRMDEILRAVPKNSSLSSSSSEKQQPPSISSLIDDSAAELITKKCKELRFFIYEGSVPLCGSLRPFLVRKHEQNPDCDAGSDGCTKLRRLDLLCPLVDLSAERKNSEKDRFLPSNLSALSILSPRAGATTTAYNSLINLAEAEYFALLQIRGRLPLRRYNKIRTAIEKYQQHYRQQQQPSASGLPASSKLKKEYALAANEVDGGKNQEDLPSSADELLALYPEAKFEDLAPLFSRFNRLARLHLENFDGDAMSLLPWFNGSGSSSTSSSTSSGASIKKLKMSDTLEYLRVASERSITAKFINNVVAAHCSHLRYLYLSTTGTLPSLVFNDKTIKNISANMRSLKIIEALNATGGVSQTAIGEMANAIKGLKLVDLNGVHISLQEGIATEDVLRLHNELTGKQLDLVKEQAVSAISKRRDLRRDDNEDDGEDVSRVVTMQQKVKWSFRQQKQIQQQGREEREEQARAAKDEEERRRRQQELQHQRQQQLEHQQQQHQHDTKVDEPVVVLSLQQDEGNLEQKIDGGQSLSFEEELAAALAKKNQKVTILASTEKKPEAAEQQQCSDESPPKKQSPTKKRQETKVKV